jgi:hypothetical protein
MRNLFLIVILGAASLSATNFNFVQQTPGDSLATETFPSNNTAGNAIIALISDASPTCPSVTDTQGNTYNAIQSSAFSVCIFAAVNIHAGSNSVTTSSGFIVALEYSSANASYYVCPGVGDLTASTTVTNVGSGQLVSPINFHSTTEVEVIWGAWIILSGQTPVVASLGTVRDQYTLSSGHTFGAGDDNQSSMTGTYTNTVTMSGRSGGRVCVFLNLDNTACLASVVSKPPTFAIIY